MCAQRKRRQPRLPRLLQPVAIRQRLTWLPTSIGLAPRSNRAISPPRAGCLSEPQTVTRLRLGLRWPKPTNRRCWPAGGFLASSRTSRKPGACTRGLRRVASKARESVCSPSDSKARPRTTLLHGSGSQAHSPLPRPGSSGAGVLPASELQHAVEGVDTDIDLGLATPVRTRAQPVPDHALEPADGGLGPGARIVARGLLPAHPALLGDE